MTRRCSHCSNNGHNSRTCPTRGGGTTTNSATNGGGGCSNVKLFGVSLTNSPLMKKSASMGNLSLYHSNSSATASPNNNANSPSPDPLHGYLSDDPNHASCSSNRRSERKKGKPWSEEEHRQFLVGLQKLGKGDWRGIARNYVMSRTPTQKEEIKPFDMVPDVVTEEPERVPEEQLFPPPPEPRETDKGLSQPSLDLCLRSEAEPMETTSTEEAKQNESHPQVPPSNMTPAFPAFYLPLPYPHFWSQSSVHSKEDNKGETSQQHRVLKPTPVLRKEPVNVNELVGMSQLNLGETETSHVVQPQVSLNLLGSPSRQSAFHASAPVSSSDLSEGQNSAIQAV
ncbi:Transcription factor MYBS3 [Bienertia sinuspersici]